MASDHFFPWVETAAYARFKIPSGDWESGSFVLYCESMSAADGAPRKSIRFPPKSCTEDRAENEAVRILEPFVSYFVVFCFLLSEASAYQARLLPKRDANRKIGIGVIRTRNMPIFIGSPGMTSGRSASNAVSASRTTCSTET